MPERQKDEVRSSAHNIGRNLLIHNGLITSLDESANLIKLGKAHVPEIGSVALKVVESYQGVKIYAPLGVQVDRIEIERIVKQIQIKLAQTYPAK